jgi:hypothetical protein
MLDIRETGRARRRWRADRTNLHSRDGVGYATALPVRETIDRSPFLEVGTRVKPQQIDAASLARQALTQQLKLPLYSTD